MPKNKKLDKAGRAARTAGGVIGGAVSLTLKIILTVVLVFLTTALLFMCIFAFYVKTTLVEEIDISLDDFSLSESSTVYDNSGGVLATLSGSENRIWVDYEDIPKDLEHALVAIEDKRFYEHKGVDWYRTVGAVFSMFLSMDSTFGGSTITQQLIKNLTGDNEVTVQRKLVEIFRALEFEKKYDKEEIIEWYLNAVYFGEGCNGIYTASQTYFGKEPSELSLAECASLVGIVNLPTYYSPYYSVENNKERQETVLREMYEQGYISYDEYTSAKNEELVFQRSETEVATQEIYPYYVEAVIDDVISDLMEVRGVNYETAEKLLYSGGYKIYTCCDSRIQSIVDTVYENPDNFPSYYSSSGQQLQSAIVIMDPHTGNIVAMSGGVGEKNGNLVLNRATDSLRPPGSSIKPLSIYAPALDLGIITQNTLVNDASPESGEVTPEHFSFYPRNSDWRYEGIITVRYALAKSKNTVAVQILDKLGIETSFSYLKNNFGLTSLVDADYNPSPLAMGQLTNGASVREMAQAYCVFANDGIFSKSRTYSQVLDAGGNIVLDNPVEQRQAIRPNTAYNMVDMMIGSVTSGTSAGAGFYGMEVAGKTGSSGDYLDRWFAGMTPYYVGVVWTGFDIPKTNEQIKGTNPAISVWRSIMQQVHEGLEYKTFTNPTSIGEDTQIFGDLTSPTPSPTPTPTPTPPATPEQTATEPPAATLPPDDVPIIPTDPVGLAA